jgi:hypothetical protein
MPEEKEEEEEEMTVHSVTRMRPWNVRADATGAAVTVSHCERFACLSDSTTKNVYILITINESTCRGHWGWP